MTGDILVFGELRNGQLKKVAAELVSGARTIAAGTGGAIDAVLIGKGAEAEAAKLSSLGLRRMTVIDEELTDRYSTEGYAKIIADLLGEVYGARVHLLVGSGANGGDALHAGAHLVRRGAAVTAQRLPALEQGEPA